MMPLSWHALLDDAARAALKSAQDAVAAREAVGAQVFPSRALRFAALEALSPDDVRAVILGQDPYPTRGNAMGLSFSVPRGVKVPGSLRNIYTELNIDLGVAPAAHGDLSAWASQGVLLLNAALTVEEGKAGSHKDVGWHTVTDALIRALGKADARPKAFLLWGKDARAKAALVNPTRHAVLEAAHPSFFSVKGFYGCKHFSKANAFLRSAGLTPIDWSLPA
jgi:uracil-DNA glycosylase